MNKGDYKPIYANRPVYQFYLGKGNTIYGDMNGNGYGYYNYELPDYTLSGYYRINEEMLYE